MSFSHSNGHYSKESFHFVPQTKRWPFSLIFTDTLLSVQPQLCFITHTISCSNLCPVGSLFGHQFIALTFLGRYMYMPIHSRVKRKRQKKHLKEAKWGSHIPWNWSYRLFLAAWHRCRKLNTGLLQKQWSVLKHWAISSAPDSFTNNQCG